MIERHSSPESGSGHLGLRSSATVLVVDDEPLVRALVAEMLRELGYDAREAGTALAALDLLETGPSIATVLTDVRMPGMGGVELVREIQRRRRDLRVVYMTGYAREAASADSQLLRHDVLIKPFSFAQLEAVMTEGSPRRH